MTEAAHGPGLFSSRGARIVILERPGCHLCEDASRVVHALATELGEEVEHTNIEDDEALARRWSLEIPVIAVDGRVINVYRANRAELRAALTRTRGRRRLASALARLTARKNRRP